MVVHLYERILYVRELVVRAGYMCFYLRDAKTVFFSRVTRLLQTSNLPACSGGASAVVDAHRLEALSESKQGFGVTGLTSIHKSLP